jgi:signal peptidase II
MQAARGASLSDVTESGTTPRPAPKARLRAIAAAAAVVGLVLDQGTKALAVDRLTGRADVHVLGDLLQLHLTRNAGAAFSTGTQFTVALSCLAAVAAVVVVVVALRAGAALWSLALGLLLAGITGNLADRLFRHPAPLRGQVVDFLMLPHWPVFNVADVCITCAAVLILLQALRGVRLDGTRERDAS